MYFLFLSLSCFYHIFLPILSLVCFPFVTYYSAMVVFLLGILLLFCCFIIYIEGDSMVFRNKCILPLLTDWEVLYLYVKCASLITERKSTKINWFWLEGFWIIYPFLSEVFNLCYHSFVFFLKVYYIGFVVLGPMVLSASIFSTIRYCCKTDFFVIM